MPSAVRVILSDLDDTLFDHHRATRSALDEVLGSDPAFERWSLDDLDACHRDLLDRFHLEVLAGRLSADEARIERFRHLLGRAGIDDAAARAPRVARAYRETYETCWHLVEGAFDLVTRVKAAGWPLIIVTNNVVMEQEQKLARLGLAPYVDHLVTSEAAGCCKPDAEIFHQALRHVDADRESAVMLGDAWATDIEGARAAGLRPVWLNRFGAASPDPSVDQLTSLAPADETLRVLTRD